MTRQQTYQDNKFLTLRNAQCSQSSICLKIFEFIQLLYFYSHYILTDTSANKLLKPTTYIEPGRPVHP
jgi:hypothetical protein